jgi:hydrogenase maturation protein HypF
VTENIKLVGAAIRTIISVTGIVQGVGFRPFVYRQAVSLGLSGSVVNTGAGVEIDIEGPATAIESMMSALRREAPPRARITGIKTVTVSPTGRAGFEIGRSRANKGAWQLVSPDSCTCDDCLTELFDPADRRYRYPFTNCTNCGPRFTVIEGLPYDRPLTTMKNFTMCPECQAEHDDPGNRRFHAVPNACPVCGPTLWLANGSGKSLPETDPIAAAASALRNGKIVAIKGLGGFQLACLATDREAVSRLRVRKHRPHKPFAVMVASLDDAALHCRMSAAERELLSSVERPIVLLDWLPDSDITLAVAPKLRQLGMLLPCSPLHFLLAGAVQQPLVMTSGNFSEEPICRTNSEAGGRLEGIADFFLFHDRQIVSTYDDSVAMVIDGDPVIIRRARGYAPLPLELPVECGSMLATGAELKNTFCLTQGTNAFMSQHIGDLKDAETLLNFERTETLYERIFRVRPDRIVCDSHPDYLSTTYSRERDPTPLQVQHHRAHVAACLAENGFTGDAVGVALDGTGFGSDGAIWGGEFFVGGLGRDFVRAAHFEYIPLLGGEAAIREPWRTSLAATWEYSPDDVDFVAELLKIPGHKLDLLVRQLEAGLNCPRTSSCGRLFDAVAALALRRLSVSYEAQAAIELEAVAGRCTGTDIYGLDGKDPYARLGSVMYRFAIDRSVTPWTISPAKAIRRIINNIRLGERPEIISRRFHLGLSEVIVRTCLDLAERHGLATVALSGGVFQNRLLLTLVKAGLVHEGLEALIHRRVPTNDGGISLGQVAIACHEHPGGKRRHHSGGHAKENKSKQERGKADVPGNSSKDN